MNWLQRAWHIHWSCKNPARETLRVWHHAEPATLRQFFLQQLWHANRRSSVQRAFLGGPAAPRAEAKRPAGRRRSEGGRRRRGRRVGGNAPRFTALFLGTLGLALAGLGGALAWSVPLALLLPLAGLVGGPAVLIAARARRPDVVPALALLYFVYGLARAIDLLGLHPRKPSWKKSR